MLLGNKITLCKLQNVLVLFKRALILTKNLINVVFNGFYYDE